MNEVAEVRCGSVCSGFYKMLTVVALSEHTFEYKFRHEEISPFQT